VRAFSVAGTPGPRSPAHARGPTAWACGDCLVNTDQAVTGSACREWGLRPRTRSTRPAATEVFVEAHSERALSCDGGHLRAQAPFAVRWLVSCLVGVDEVTTANPSRSPASVGRRTRVTPSRYRSRPGTPVFENNSSQSKRRLCAGTPLPARHQAAKGGGTKQRYSVSSQRAKRRHTGSASNGPQICAPIGSPSFDRPSGTAVAGRPHRLV
jgi:hypothetical protein